MILIENASEGCANNCNSYFQQKWGCNGSRCMFYLSDKLGEVCYVSKL